MAASLKPNAPRTGAPIQSQFLRPRPDTIYRNPRAAPLHCRILYRFVAAAITRWETSTPLMSGVSWAADPGLDVLDAFFQIVLQRSPGCKQLIAVFLEPFLICQEICHAFAGLYPRLQR